MNENSAIEKLQFSHNRPGSREGIIKIVVSGTSESAEDIRPLMILAQGKAVWEGKSSIINTKSQLPLGSTSMECLSKDTVVDVEESKDDVEGMTTPIGNQTSTNMYFVDANKGSDSTAISLLRQKFRELCIKLKLI